MLRRVASLVSRQALQPESVHRDGPGSSTSTTSWIAPIEVFREHGYHASLMADIERAIGLNSSSTYNTFGSKKTLFGQSLSRYETVPLAAIFEILGAGTEGVADLHRALELQQAKSLSEWGHAGCLATNTMIELGPRAGLAVKDMAEFRRQLAEAIRVPLDRAVALGEMDPDRVTTAAAMLVTFTLAPEC